MKRIILTSVLAVMTVSAALSQGVGVNTKVDKDSYLKKIERSNTDVENPKKNTKANVWLDRGKLFHDAATAPWGNLYRGMTEQELILIYGKAEPEARTVGNKQFDAYDYTNFTAYLRDGGLIFWEPKISIVDNAYESALEAYGQAYTVEPKSAAKVKAGLEQLANSHKKEAENYFGQEKYDATADHFAHAYEVQRHPAVNEIDTISLYNAGMFYTFAGTYDKGARYLEEAEKYNFESDGDLYYFLYHNYYGLEQNDKAKSILQKGISRFPGNTQIVEGLVGIYSVTESDPTEIVDIVNKSIEENPDNPLLWSGLGGIHIQMQDYEKAIPPFQKAVELAPNDFYHNFRLAYAHIEMGDEYNKRLNELTPGNSAEYNNALEVMYQEYEKALPPLERAHVIDPTNAAAVELLKNLTFRLRDRDESIMQKYEKYNELFKSM